MHESVLVAACAMSVPYDDRRYPLVSALKKAFGDPFDPASEPMFMYILHHNMPEAAIEYASDVRETLLRLYGENDPDASPPEVTSPHLYIDGKPVGMTRRSPRPSRLPDWITEEEFQYYVREFESRGFEGGLNWYRTGDINAILTKHLDRKHIAQPVLFIAGEDDMVTVRFGGSAKISHRLQQNCDNLQKVVFFKGAGHWIQQEKAAEVNATLLEWLGKLSSDIHQAVRPDGMRVPSVAHRL